MNDTRRTVRIFISSPGDVADERDQARRVIERLQREYPQALLLPLLWEELALPATASFQETIDLLLGQRPVDVAIFVLWSRLGTPLGAATVRPDGSPYRSGTEREFDLMLAAFEQSGRQRPVILAYARDDDAAFRKRLTETPGSDLEELIAQRKLAESFIREQFYDAQGRNLRALQTYKEPIGFAQRLRVHLRHALDSLLGVDVVRRWHDEPYRGLQVFDAPHAAIFQGRDEETCDLLQRLRDQDRNGCAFVVIVGASGSGKSSLARAGVAATLLLQAGDDEVHEWRSAIFVPSLGADNLLTALTRTLVEVLPEVRDTSTKLAEIIAGLGENPGLTVNQSITPPATRAAGNKGRPIRVLLVFDQMEELWTDRRITPEDRRRFFEVLEALARSGHCAVLATLRSDFYPHAQQTPEFLRLKGERGHFDLLPPAAAALHRLIVEPARLAGLRFERDESSGRTLDEVILRDATRDPSALPLLQYALSELYHHRDTNRRLLTFTAYEALGGVEGALARRADELFQSLPDEARAALAEILPLLVTVDVAGEQAAVRRRAPQSELTATPARKLLTERLIAARLLTTDRQDDMPVAALAHEALLHRWDRIAEWITANREHLRLRARVEQSHQRWGRFDRDASLLLSAGLPLEEGRQLLSDAPQLLGDGSEEYIRVSIEHHEQQARRQRRRRQVVVAALSLLTLLSTIGGGFAWLQQREAQRQRQVAEKRTSESVENLERAEHQLYLSQVFRAAEAITAGRSQDAMDLISTIPFSRRQWDARYIDRLAHGTSLTLREHEDMVQSVAFSQDGERIVSGGRDKTVRVWDVRTGIETLTLSGHESFVMSVAFSPDGLSIVSGGDSVKLWDALAGTELLTLGGHGDLVRSVAFSPDGFSIVSGGHDNTVRMWNVPTGTETLTLSGHESFVMSVAFSPDGLSIVSGGSDNTVRVWDARTGTEKLTLRGHEASITSVTFSPNARSIVSGSLDGTLRIWDARTGTGTESFSLRVSSFAFSPDGRSIVCGGQDGAVIVWDAQSGTVTLTFREHEDLVSSVAYSQDGRTIISGSHDKTVKMWDSRTGGETLTLGGHKHWVNSVAFSPDGRRIATGDRDKTVKVWDSQTGIETLTLDEHEAAVNSVAFSPDGLTIVSGSADKTVKVWDARTGTESLTLRGHDNFVTSVAFSPDGLSIVSGSADKTVKVWDARTGTELLTLRGHDNYVTSVAFSPDGRSIISGSGDDTVKVWDARHGTVKLTLHGHNSGVNSAAFRPDGQTIVSGGSDNTVRVWDAETGTESYTLLGHQGPVTSVAFSPDGRSIVSGSSMDYAVRVWDVRTGAKMLTLHGHKGSVTSVAFSPDGQRIVSGSAISAKVWDARVVTETLALRGHDRWVTSVAFSPDGRRIVSRDDTNRKIVWDSATATPVEEPPPPETIGDTFDSPDGKIRIVPSNNRTHLSRHANPGFYMRETLQAEMERGGIHLIRTNPDYDPWAEYAARREAWEPVWCENDAAECEEAEDWFAARFHLRRLRELHPDDEAVAARLDKAESMLAAESSVEQDDPVPPAPANPDDDPPAPAVDDKPN